jgi:hypothetical protein
VDSGGMMRGRADHAPPTAFPGGPEHKINVSIGCGRVFWRRMASSGAGARRPQVRGNREDAASRFLSRTASARR